MRGPAKVLATTLALLAGRAAASPGDGIGEWVGSVAVKEPSFQILVGGAVSDWAQHLRTAAGAAAGTVVRIYIDTSVIALNGYKEGEDIKKAQTRVENYAKHLKGLAVPSVIFVWVVESKTRYYRNGQISAVGKQSVQYKSNQAIMKWLKENSFVAVWADEAIGKDYKLPAEGVGGVLVATAIALGTAAALFTHDWDGLFAPMCLMPVVPPKGAGRRDVATHTALVYRDKFLAIVGITSSILSLLFALSWSNILDRFARRIGEPRLTDGRVIARLAESMGIVSRRMNHEKRDGEKTGFPKPANFNPAANKADRTYKQHLKLVNTMVVLFVEGPWSKRDFEALKKRVKHFMESARLQRTGRESDSADDDAPILAPPPESEAWAAEDAAFAADWENASEDGASDEAAPAAAPASAPMDDDDDDSVPEIPGTTI